MTDNTGLTNIPDYQKIRQTTRTSGNQGNSEEWSEGIETLTPSPVVRQPNSPSDSPRLMQQQQTGYSNYTWEKSASHSPSVAAKGTGTSKASWEAQTQYHPNKYGISTLSGSSGDGPYITQGYTRPVTKYVDANGVERRVIRRTVSPASINRRSYTEGFLISNASDYSHYGENARLKSASSQKNLHHADMFGTAAKRDGASFMQSSGEARDGRKAYSMINPQEEWKEVVGVSIAPKTPHEDLRHWQQQHQEELLHQHLETQALYESPPNQVLQGQVLTDPSMAKLSLQEEPPARWEPVRRAADNIIREKNMIIDKLKNRILELEEDFKASETKLRQALLHNQDDNDLVQQRLQEMQHKNATLKERMNEERVKRDSEIDDLDVKLGASEHEVQKLKELLRRKDMDVSGIENQIAEAVHEAATWRQQFEDSRSTHQDMKKKLDSLQRYLNDLPTVEESRLQAKEILSVREENIALKSKVDSSEKKLSQVRKVITARDFRIRELEEREKELEIEISNMTGELEHLRDAEGYELFKIQKEVQSLRAEKEKLNEDLDKAKKLLETTHLKLRQVEAKSQNDLTRVQERMTQEAEAVESLRTEIAIKDEQMEKMKKTIRDLGNQSQELLHQGLMAKEYARNLEAGSTEATVAEHGRFMTQLGLCFSELKALVEVCTKQAHGEEPDISVLLGFKDPGLGDDGATSSQMEQAQTLSQWLTQLSDLRKQVDRLRAHICNKYAEDMGNKVNCATQ